MYLRSHTLEIANVRMMKSENGSLLVSETTMSPKVNDPSFGQYWIHFICLNVYIIDLLQLSLKHRYLNNSVNYPIMFNKFLNN